MTYLELVNAVLRKLREDEVTTVQETDYSRLIGDFVNDAKRFVENSWDWTSLRTTYTINTVAGTNLYSLADFGTRSKVLYAHNETDKLYLTQESLQQIRRNEIGDVNNGTVVNYAIEGVDANGDARIRVFPTPEDAQVLSFYTVKRTGDLSDDSDELELPAGVVIHFAYSYGLVERGETGGQSGAEQAVFAKSELTDAIALDANLHPEELIWDTV
jgi:hypothetical protein